MSRLFSLSSKVPLLVVEELGQAGIPCLKNLSDKSAWFCGEPEGKLENWDFYRQSTAWGAESPRDKGLTRATMREFKARWDDTIELVDANVDYIFAVYIYSPDCLTAFAHLIRAFAKE